MELMDSEIESRTEVESEHLHPENESTFHALFPPGHVIVASNLIKWERLSPGFHVDSKAGSEAHAKGVNTNKSRPLFNE